MRRLVGAVVSVAAVAGLAACAADPDDSKLVQLQNAAAATVPVSTVTQSDQSYPPNGLTDSVLAIDNNFLPQTLSIAAGTEVVFENNGRNDHNVIPVGDLETATWGVQAESFAPKATYSHVFDRPGTYVFYCSIHGTPKAGMVGTIVVTEP
ncbi:MAG: plastocyanin/azurin family copper-binding protein [Ilumatobacteraceae bacterium]